MSKAFEKSKNRLRRCAEKYKKAGSVLVLLAVLLVLAACGGTAPSPEPQEPAASVHSHRFDAETGTCRDCGQVCAHPAFEEGVCQACGWRCLHESHDPETVRCLRCGEDCCHHFGAAGICACGMEAPLALQRLDAGWFEPAEHPGQCLHETLSDGKGRQIDLALWLPWDYDPAGKYNVILLLHGDGGTCGDWVDREIPTALGPIRLCTVYDHLAEERLCEPFLVVSLENRLLQNPAEGERLLRETVLPYLAEHYATWMEDGSGKAITAAREHLAIGGLSRGSMLAYSVGMGRCLDLFGNYCCFSIGEDPGLVGILSKEENREYWIRCYVAAVGLRDLRDYVQPHRQLYGRLCRETDALTDGENARLLEIDEGHDFLMWSAAVYDALLLLF